MGNLNKKDETTDPHQSRPIYAPSRLGHNRNLSPPKFIKNGNTTNNNKETNDDGSANEDKGGSNMASQAIHAPQPHRQPSLSFKSYGKGMLMNNQFPHPQQFIAPFPPPTQFPFKNPSASLYGSSPSFYPTPNRFPAPLNPSTPPHTYNRSQPRYETPFFGQAPQYQPDFHRSSGYYPKPEAQGHYFSSPLSIVSNHHQDYDQYTPPFRQQLVASYQPVIPPREPKVLLVKQDKSRKDILIDENGITRNVIQVTESYLTSGVAYQTVDVGAVKSDVMALLEKMDEDERTDFLRKNWIEIFVSLKSQEDEEAEIAETEKEKQLTKTGDQSGEPSTKSIVTAKKIPKLVKILQNLPEYFFTTTTRLMLILSFPTLTNPPIPTGPRALQPATGRSHFTLGNSTHTISSSTSYQTHPNFYYISLLVHELNRFSALQKMDVILAPPPNMRTPMTLPQLNCFLPFYDLEFTEWTAGWRTTFMGRSEVLKAWPLEYINGQRERILGERQRILMQMDEEGLVGEMGGLRVGDREVVDYGGGESASFGAVGTDIKGKGKERCY